MKKIIVSAATILLGFTTGYAQKYITRAGKVSFKSNGNEDIRAVNSEVNCILDATTGKVGFQIMIKSFKFEKALMQEHFNENYMESDQYPKAEFSGKIDNMEAAQYQKDGTYKVTTTGTMTVHGVKKEVAIPGTIIVAGDKLTLQANFAILFADYAIKIPDLVTGKVGTKADVKLETMATRK
jgi:polyisoprenoid-binding protein YceI